MLEIHENVKIAKGEKTRDCGRSKATVGSAVMKHSPHTCADFSNLNEWLTELAVKARVFY